LIAAVMVLIPSRLGRAACPSEIAVIEPPIETNELLAGTKSNLHGGQPANSRRSLRGFFKQVCCYYNTL